MKNQEIAKIFYDMADILELLSVEWKPRAYRRAAQSIELLSEDIEIIYKKGGLKKIEEIPGVGERIGEKIIEYLKTGKIKEYNKLKKKLPKGLIDLMEVSTLGPKKTKVLYEKLKIKNIKQLEKAIKKHKVAKLEHFGLKTEENIQKGIGLFKKRGRRLSLGTALSLSNELIKSLSYLKEIDRIEAAGSLRRMQETIGDIDILATTSSPRKVMDFFVRLPQVKGVLAKGLKKSMVILENGAQADLRIVRPLEFGAALQYFTGNKQHNIKLRQIAIKKGYKLNEYGLFKGDKKIAGATEKEVYKKLNLPYLPPEIRHGQKELELKSVPRLVKLEDIKGDFHIHTKYSEGANTIMEIVSAAKNLKYSYIAVTDHSKARAIANGMPESRLLKQIKEIDMLNKKLKNFKIFKSAEVDIKKDGSLDYSDIILRKLDFAVAAVHSSFNLSEREQTKRIIKALENKYVRVLAHPSCRLIGFREEIRFNLSKVLDVAKANNKFLEINANAQRLDLRDVYINEAVENKNKLVVSTDAHSTDSLNFMLLGVAQARRGFAGKRDIINTLNLREVERVVKA